MEEIETEEFETIAIDMKDALEFEDLNERRIYLLSMIDETAISRIVYHILRYNRLDKDIPVKHRMPIVLFISSLGGKLEATLSVIDAIMCSKTPVYTVNLGACASGAMLIYLAGKKRFALPHSHFLLHDGMDNYTNSVAKVQDYCEFSGKVEQSIKEYVLERTSIDSELYDSKYRCEWYMLPEEAKKYKIVTNIIGKGLGFDYIYA